MKKILLTGGGGAGVEALHRLWSQNYDVYFADACLEAIPATILPEKCVPIPFATSSNFIDSVVSICRNLAIDIIVPTVDEELPFMAQIAGQVPGLRVLAPEPRFVATMLDKYTTARAWADAGLAAPETWLGSEIDKATFPCIAKPRRGRGSRGVMVVENEAAASAYLVLYDIKPNDVIMQELLTGQEYTVLAAADANGKLRAVVPVLVGEKRSVTLRAETQANDVITQAVEVFHKSNPTPGSYNVQLMLTDDAQASTFEINPRISTTTCLAIAAGIDPITVFEGQFEGNVLLPFKQGMKLRRYWTNHIR